MLAYKYYTGILEQLGRTGTNAEFLVLQQPPFFMSRGVSWLLFLSGSCLGFTVFYLTLKLAPCFNCISRARWAAVWIFSYRVEVTC